MPPRRTFDPLVNRIGARLHGLRKEKGLSLEKVAWGAELSGKGFVSQAERGLALPTLITLARIADSLGVTLVDVVNVPENGPRFMLIEITRWLNDQAVRKLLRQATEYLSETEAPAAAAEATPGYESDLEPAARTAPPAKSQAKRKRTEGAKEAAKNSTKSPGKGGGKKARKGTSKAPQGGSTG